MTRLSVNVNKVATLRNTRTNGIPSVVNAARLCLDAGADGITVHPRPDQRHIRPADVVEIAALLKSYPHAEYNIEGNPYSDYLAFAETHRPTQCTLVPDSPEAFTSDHGWDLERDSTRLQPIVERLHALGCRVSLFMDALPAQIERAARLGAARIELYTEPYACAFAEGKYDEVLATYARAAKLARQVGLEVNAGHDLNRDNLPAFLKAIPFIAEVSIGHALIADALEFGLVETVRRYREIVRQVSAPLDHKLTG